MQFKLFSIHTISYWVWLWPMMHPSSNIHWEKMCYNVCVSRHQEMLKANTCIHSNIASSHLNTNLVGRPVATWCAMILYYRSNSTFLNVVMSSLLGTIEDSLREGPEPLMRAGNELGEDAPLIELVTQALRNINEMSESKMQPICTIQITLLKGQYQLSCKIAI